MAFGSIVYVKENHIPDTRTTYKNVNFPFTVMHKWCKVFCKLVNSHL